MIDYFSPDGWAEIEHIGPVEVHWYGGPKDGITDIMLDPHTIETVDKGVYTLYRSRDDVWLYAWDELGIGAA